MEESHLKTIIKECLEEFFFSDCEHAPFNQLFDRIDKLTEVAQLEERAELAVKICDKFEDYMKNIDKLNSMINEFKGLVAIVRGQTNHNQDQLYCMSCSMNGIQEMLMPDDEDSIMDRLDMIEEEIQKIDRMSDQLALIIKLLRKNE